MTELYCSVANCANNQDSCCCRPDIKVGGPDSRSPKQTYCSNFLDESEGAPRDAVDSKNPNPTLDVHCEVENCVYNRGTACVADRVDIRTTRVNHGQIKTECSTFRCEHGEGES